MSISEISTSEMGIEDSDWGDSLGEATNLAEFGGQQREISHLQEEYEIMNKIMALLHRKENHKSSLRGRAIAHNRSVTSKIRPMGGGSVEANIVISWDDKDTKVSGGISAEAHDDNGNYAKIEVNQDSDGKGSATVKAGHKDED